MVEKNTHKVNPGSSFLSGKNAKEMMLHLSSSLLSNNVVKPLNEGRRFCFSLFYDGQYIIKACRNRLLHSMCYQYNIQMTQTLQAYTWHCKIQ